MIDSLMASSAEKSTGKNSSDTAEKGSQISATSTYFLNFSFFLPVTALKFMDSLIMLLNS